MGSLLAPVRASCLASPCGVAPSVRAVRRALPVLHAALPPRPLELDHGCPRVDELHVCLSPRLRRSKGKARGFTEGTAKRERRDSVQTIEVSASLMRRSGGEISETHAGARGVALPSSTGQEEAGRVAWPGRWRIRVAPRKQGSRGPACAKGSQGQSWPLGKSNQ